MKKSNRREEVGRERKKPVKRRTTERIEEKNKNRGRAQ